MRIIDVLFFLIFIIISGCRNNVSLNEPPTSNDTITSQKEIWPLALGNTWTYDVFIYDSTGNVRQSASGSISVVRESVINNSKWYQISTSDWWFANRDSGLYLRIDTDTCLYFKYPGNVKDSSYVIPYGSYSTIFSTDTSITTKSGKYSCYAYNVNRGFFTRYFSVGVGIIKEEQYLLTNSGRRYMYISMSLSSVSLK
jgi:hypothetical protein